LKQQGLKSSLLEMSIRGERHMEAELPHDDKRGAIGQPPFLITAGFEQLPSGMQNLTGSRNNLDSLVTP
jgi:hypothetical protein